MSVEHFVIRTFLLGATASLALTAACGDGGDDGSSEDGAGGGGSGTGGSGGSSGSASGKSALPVPPGPDDLPPPSGTATMVRVLPWAGFSAAFSYTFDDSQPSQVEHWQELAATGVRMTFYINTTNNWIAGYDTTWKDALAQGHEIGNHTVHHCRTTELGGANPATCANGLATAEEEIDQCSDYITSTVGQSDVWTFAYPFGDTGYRAAAESRFILARGVNSGTIAGGGDADPMNLPTIAHTGDPGVPGGDPLSTFVSDIDTVVAQERWLIYLFHSILPTTNNWYAGEDIAVITGSIEHAKSLGTVWLDSVVNIGAYWLGVRAFNAATPTQVGQEITWTWTLPENFPPGRVVRVVVEGGTLSQNGKRLTWDGHGYYEMALDARTLTFSP